MKRSVLLGLTLTLCLSLAGFYVGETSVTSAQGGQGQRPQGSPSQDRRGGGGEGMMFRLLDLTSDQKEQIKKLHDVEREASKPIHDQLETIHDQLHAATKDGAFNEPVVRSLLNQTQQPELELEVLHIKTRSAIFNILTPAQKAKLTEVEATMGKNHDDPPPPPRD